MSEDQFHEEELKVLKEESRLRNNYFVKIGTTIIFLLLSSISGGIYMFVNHESRITKTETVQQTYLNNSGVEFTARSVTAETEARLNKRIDDKADKSEFQLIFRELDNMNKKLDELNKK